MCGALRLHIIHYILARTVTLGVHYWKWLYAWCTAPTHNSLYLIMYCQCHIRTTLILIDTALLVHVWCIAPTHNYTLACTVSATSGLH